MNTTVSKTKNNFFRNILYLLYLIIDQTEASGLVFINQKSVHLKIYQPRLKLDNANIFIIYIQYYFLTSQKHYTGSNQPQHIYYICMSIALIL